VLISRVFGKSDALVFVVVEPIHLAPLLRILGVHISPVYHLAVVVVLFDIGIQIKIRDGFVDGIYAVLS
jgi:hypothetical protein